MIDPDRHAFAGELIDDVQHAEFASIMGAILDEIVGPDMVRILWPQTDAGSVIQPQPPFLRLLLRDFQPLPSPDPLDAFDVHGPACRVKHRRDPAVAVAAVLGRKRDDVGGQHRIVGPSRRRLALRRTMLAQSPAGEALRDIERRHDVIDATAATGGAQKFPEAASRRMSFSSVRSETALRSRSFSFSRSFSRFT